MLGNCNYDVTSCSANADCVETDEPNVTSHWCVCREGFRGNGTRCKGEKTAAFIFLLQKKVLVLIMN